MNDFSSAILDLQPVTFKYVTDDPQTIRVGLIAEQVAKIMNILVATNDKGEIESIKYHDLVPLLLNELIKQNKKIENLETRLSKLEEID